jgi:hypothetical protein
MFAQHWWYSITDLPERRRRWPGKAKSIRECLQPGGFSHGQGAFLPWVNVPVPVLRDMRRDRPRQIVLIESLVFVLEYILTVTLDIF